MAVKYEDFMKEIAKSGNLFKARFNSMETVIKLLNEIPQPYGTTLKIGTFAALDYDGDQQYLVIGGSEILPPSPRKRPPMRSVSVCWRNSWASKKR